jgi:signal transduction histidine kinase
MSDSNFALLGLDTDKRVVWKSESAASLLPDGLSGQLLEEVFPNLRGQIELERAVQVEAPGTSDRFCVLPSRVQSSDYEWLVRLDRDEQESGQTNRLLAWRIVDVCHESRVDLVEELHQGVQQVLAALLIRLGGMGETASEDNMREIRDLVARALDDLRTVTKTVAPAALDAGLNAALVEFSEILARHAGLKLLVPTGELRRYPRSIEIVAYDAIRVLLTACSHRGIKEASVSLHDTPGALRVIVELHDFTKGIDDVLERLEEKFLGYVHASVAIEIDSENSTLVFSFPTAGDA